jgi:hypothetical protein
MTYSLAVPNSQGGAGIIVSNLLVLVRLMVRYIQTRAEHSVQCSHRLVCDTVSEDAP